MSAVQPYLIFSGNCEEAIKFYCNVFKGDISFLQRYHEAPGDFPEKWKDKIMHVCFIIKDTMLMASDNDPGG